MLARCSSWPAGRKIKTRYLSANRLLEGETYIDCSLFANSGVAFSAGGGTSRFSTSAVVNIGRGGGLVPFLLRSEAERLWSNQVFSASPLTKGVK